MLAALLLLAADHSAAARNKHRQQQGRQQQLSAATVNRAELSGPASAHQPGAVLLKAQVLLDRAGFSPGAIDARRGDNFSKALAAFQGFVGLAPTGELDPATWARLSENSGVPALVDYTIGEDDVKGPFTPRIPGRLEQMARLDRLAYGSPIELLAEKFHADQGLLKGLNPGRRFEQAGTVISVPNVADARPDGAVSRVEVDKAHKAVRALDDHGGLVAFYPASVGSEDKPAPSGVFRVRKVVEHPVYHYDPKFHFKGVKTRRPFTIAPGPNNPVGIVWIDLSKPSYGIHGTPDPTKIGKTQSHGCIRLTNWDALDLARRVRKGISVAFLD
jgi:lipoprotein-anchoring transpeptidase ErfK/SrfK